MSQNSNENEIHLVELSEKMHRHSRLVTTAIAGILLVSTLAAGLYWFEKNNTGKEEVLGLTQTADMTPALNEQGLLGMCQDKNGVVLTKQISESEANRWCVLENGQRCLLNQEFAQGGCTTDEGVVLGLINESDVSPTPLAPISISPTPQQSLRAYGLQITQKPDAIAPVESQLADYVSVALDLKATGRRLVRLIYNSEFGNPLESDTRYYFDYIVLIDGDSLETPAEYDDYATIMRLTEINQDLIPYLLNSDYCETEADCVIRRSKCIYGAFNRYEQYVDGFACMKLQDEFGDNVIHFDENQNCKAERIFAAPVCENNSCLPTQQASRCMQ